MTSNPTPEQMRDMIEALFAKQMNFGPATSWTRQATKQVLQNYYGWFFQMMPQARLSFPALMKSCYQRYGKCIKSGFWLK